MSHSGHMSMGSASLPDLPEFPHFYWAVVGSAIGVATLVNIYNHVLCRQRLSAARAGTVAPAKPKTGFTVANATTFALVREASNFSLHIPLKGRILRLPTVGRASLVLANAITLIVLCFYGLELNGRPIEMETVGHRCGVVVISQLPLLFLLAGKNNIVGYLSGISYERLNWLHRWAARCMLLTATFHMGYFFRSWDAYKYIGTQLKTNEVAWKGLAAWCVLLWITFSSMTPIRGWNYELFVIQHLLSFTMFMVFVYLHIPVAYRGYFWTSVALFFLDRTLRAIRVLYANVSLFHPTKRGGNGKEGFWACEAEFTPLPHNTTRVVITNPPISWTPGQHVFLSCHSVAPLQSHPFTIASIPEDGRMEFLIKAEKGGTRRFFKHAERSHGLGEASTRTKIVAIEGPYGCLRPLRQFDSVVFLAGSTGATFTFPLLRDILQGWKENANPGSSKRNSFSFARLDGAVTRHVRFAWVVKSKGQLGWLSEQLSTIYQDFESLQDTLRDIKLEITVYVTCDETFTEEHNTLLSSTTAPNGKAEPKSKPVHGVVQYRGPQQVSGEAGDVEMSEMKNKPQIESEVTESPPTTATSKTCNCRTTIDETASPDTTSQPCCCSPAAKGISSKHNRLSSESSTSPLLLKQKLFVHPAITVYAGRPMPRDIIRRSLEQALGESAVVVCGPQGLVADVKRDVCALSDERAVHKGTGAQGIYLHTESFGY